MTNADIDKGRRRFLFVKRMVQLVAAVAVFTGCDVLNKAPEASAAVAKPSVERPVVSAAVSEESISTNEVKTITLVAGQSEAEVRQLLGQPSGRMSSANRSVLLYSGEALDFVDGRLTTDVPDIQARIAAKNRAVATKTPEPDSEPKTESGIQRAFNKISALNMASAEKKITPFVLMDERNREIDHQRLIVPGKITVVDFYATWCGPCRQMGPLLEKMVREQADVVLRKVDIGNWGSEVATRYNVKSVPNVRVFDRKGRLVAQPTSNLGAIASQIETARRQE